MKNWEWEIEFDKKFISPKTLWCQDKNGKWLGKQDVKDFIKDKIEEAEKRGYEAGEEFAGLRQEVEREFKSGD